MNVLTKNNISISWLLAYVGIDSNWLSINDVLKHINPIEMDKLDINQIGDLYVAAEQNKEIFLEQLRKITIINDDTLKIGLWVWSIAYLNDVLKSNKVISEKLRDVANIWAMVNYPDNWKEFIYYMPVPANEEVGEDKVFNKLVGFIKQENDKLRAYGYLE